MIPTVHQHATLELTTPLTSCCNCGAMATPERGIELVDTPLTRTRYFLFFGSELTIMETFPYCKACRSSAARLRQGWFSKFLAACLLWAVLATVMAFVAPHLRLPPAVDDNLVKLCGALAFLLTYFYFRTREAPSQARSHYQPVSLAAVEGDAVTLRLTNWRYAKRLADANADRVRHGFLNIVSTREGHGEVKVGQ